MFATQTSPPERRQDSVAQLLGQIWDDALEPGYAETAARRQAHGPDDGAEPADLARHDRRRRLGWRGAGAVLVVLLLALAAAQTRASAPAVAARRTDLIARIGEQTSAYDTTTARVTALQAEVAALKSDALASTGQGEQLERDLAVLEQQAAQVAVAGPGLTVTLDDAETPPPGTDPAVDRVLDRDLQSVVNGLWLAGAEAVAVNGQRLTSLSAIRSAGDAILVDYRPLTRPYVVTAIGDPSKLEASFSAGPAGRGLRTLQQTYGIRYSVDPADRLALAAASAVELRYARPKEAQR